MTGIEIRKRLAAEDRRRQILEVAAELFVARGFEAVTMTDLAGALHVSRPTMYTYFASPEAVLGALLSEQLQAFWAKLEEQLTRLLPPATSPQPLQPQPPQPQPPQLPPHLFSSLLAFLVGERATLSLLHCGGGPAFQRRRLAFLDELAARLARLRPAAERSPYLLLLLTQLLDSVAFRVSLLPPDQPTALAEALDAFVRGGSALLLEEGLLKGEGWRGRGVRAAEPLVLEVRNEKTRAGRASFRRSCFWSQRSDLNR